jgi:hypothetical protein
VAAFVSIPFAVIWLPEGSGMVAAGIALALFVVAQLTKLIGLVEALDGLFDKEGRRQRQAIKTHVAARGEVMRSLHD